MMRARHPSQMRGRVIAIDRFVEDRAVLQRDKRVAAEDEMPRHPRRDLRCLEFGKRIGKIAR